MRASSTSQPKKIKKVINSPQKHIVTGLTQNKITTDNMIPPPNAVYSPPINPQIQQSSMRGKFMLQKYGLVYDGTLVNNSFHGQGILYNPTDPNRYIYKGAWAFGSRNGFGHYIYPDGSEYRGEWRNNLKQGQGLHINRQGQKYQGFWSQNRRHGQGRMQLQNRTILSGNWINDQFIDGIITFPDGGRYEGQMSQFTRNGRGTYYYPDKTKYIGQWSRNMKDGQAKINYSNNDQFIGSFKQNMKHGQDCQYIWKEGLIFEGVFNNDRVQSGTLTKLSRR